jgi:CMP/dCMP kinase
MIIAIDGPSGAGKSTLGKMLARELDLLYLDTGAMYRAGALAVLRAGISFEDEVGVADLIKSSAIELTGNAENQKVSLDGNDVTTEIRTLEVAQAASRVSTNSAVRRRMVERGCVLEGRDIGTVVFPNADVKFFLTAEPAARARRRFEEDKAKGRVSTYEQTLAEINERDERDVSRDDSPLQIPDGSEVIDTSELDLNEVFEQMLTVIRERKSAAA